HPSSYFGGPHSDRDGAQALRRRHHAGRGARSARAAGNRAADRSRPADRGRTCCRIGRALGAVAGGGRRARTEERDAVEAARARAAPGCRIFSGSENRMFALSGSSVIAAPYRGSQGDVVGVVGVIGPTRLNYARVIPMVDFTAKALTRLMA